MVLIAKLSKLHDDLSRLAEVVGGDRHMMPTPLPACRLFVWCCPLVDDEATVESDALAALFRHRRVVLVTDRRMNAARLKMPGCYVQIIA